MFTDEFGQIVFSEDDLLEYYLKNPDKVYSRFITETPVVFPDMLELKNVPKCQEYVKPNCSQAEFDTINQSIWHMPDEYKNFDIAKFVLDRCANDAELQRAGQELLLYQEKDMFMLLKYLKYLVDTMRQNNIVWGVGRGSSVASFVLYLIGLHKINSLHYDLPIEEFLK